MNLLYWQNTAKTGVCMERETQKTNESLIIGRNAVAEAVKSGRAIDTLLVAKQSVWIGLGICFLLMLIASTGVIPALLGAILQEVIDTISILSALRARKDR